MSLLKSVGLLGGTGDLGTALAIHLARHYDRILLGSRDKSKAEITIREIVSEKGDRGYLSHLLASENAEVAKQCDLIIATIPHTNAVQTIESLVESFRGGQVLISAVAPIVKSGDEFFPDLDATSISERIETIVPKSVKVATAFQTVPANVLYKERDISSDVLVACNELETYVSVADLVTKVEGLRPLYLGSLKLSRYIEDLTSMILNIGLKNKLKSPTIKFNSF